jgi:hypothetical protein
MPEKIHKNTERGIIIMGQIKFSRTDDVKKTVKKKETVVKGYYESEFDKMTYPGIDCIKLKIDCYEYDKSNNRNQTNWINLNKDSAKVLIKKLKEMYKI